MGLFNRKDKKEENKVDIPRLPDLPQLPQLPDFSDTDDYANEDIAKLSNIPSNPWEGNDFSQNNIKEAVTGKKEVEEDANDFAIRSEMQTMRSLPFKEEKISQPSFEKMRQKKTEPLFIRIDKFEDGSKAFGEVRKQILQAERLFKDLKIVKENEEKEIKSFEEEIKQIKIKLESIDQNIFSKIE